MTSAQHVYEVRPRKDHRGVDLISDALPFGRLWYGEPDAMGRRWFSANETAPELMMRLPNIAQSCTPFLQCRSCLLYIFEWLLLMRHICISEPIDVLDLPEKLFRCDWAEMLFDRLKNPAERLALGSRITQRPA